MSRLRAVVASRWVNVVAVFVVLCFGLCMVRTARQIRKEEQR